MDFNNEYHHMNNYYNVDKQMRNQGMILEYIKELPNDIIKMNTELNNLCEFFSIEELLHEDLLKIVKKNYRNVYFFI